MFLYQTAGDYKYTVTQLHRWSSSMCSKTVLGLFVFFSSIPVVGGPQHLGCIYGTLDFTDPLQNITIRVKVCTTLVLRDDWHLDPHKSLFVVDWAYLQDTQMKDGIVSLNLTNVVNDNDGRVKPGGQGKDQDKDGGEQDRGKPDGYVGLKVAQKNVIAEPGQNASLPRQVCVKNRVDLQDQETKGGDVNSTLLDAMNAERRVAWGKKIRERATLILNRSIFLRFVPPVYPQDTQMKHGNGTVMIDDRGTDNLSVVDPPGQRGGHTGVFFRTSCDDMFSCAI